MKPLPRRKKSALLVYLPVILSVGSFLGYFYFIWQDGYVNFSFFSEESSNVGQKENRISKLVPTTGKPSTQQVIHNAVSAAAIALLPRDSNLKEEIMFARSSPVPGIWWPRILDISPSYVSTPPKVDTLNDIAANYANSSHQYPLYTSLLKFIESWNPDHPEIPTTFLETLQHFNYSNPLEREIAARYRDAEVPFKLYNVPEVDRVSEKWTVDYLSSKTRYSGARVERANHNHFMFWSHNNMKRVDPTWKPPTEHVSMSFAKWYQLALAADENKLSNESEHYYFHCNARAGDRSGFVAKDLPFFATSKKNFFITNVEANKGIQCRFGMRGIIAETHYDGGRNMVAMIKGQKRYILTPPYTCQYLGIISDKKHTSFRHSLIDWSNVDQCKAAHFDRVAAIDTIVREGEILYIPSYWFHYPISLQYSIQCNSRSGSPPRGEGQKEIETCMKYKFDTKWDLNFRKGS